MKSSRDIEAVGQSSLKLELLTMTGTSGSLFTVNSSFMTIAMSVDVLMGPLATRVEVFVALTLYGSLPVPPNKVSFFNKRFGIVGVYCTSIGL